LAISYFRSFGLPVKIVRPFNTYGPRQSARAIIPTIISQILNGVTELKLGNLSPTRDLNYVKDTVKGFLAIAENDTLNGEIVNIGSGIEISMRDLVSLIASIMGERITIKTDELRIRPGKSEVERLCCDNSKITSATNWNSKYNLQIGLTETIEWFKQNMTNYKAYIYNV